MSAALDYVLSKFNGVRLSGARWMALCPVHADKNPSLSISEKDGKILLHCFVGCAAKDICLAAGIEMNKLFERNSNCKASKRKIVATYDYTDGKGETLFQVVRYEPKDFRQRVPNECGGWTWNVRDVPSVLYRLPEILASSEIVLVEGEKDVESGRRLGLCATTSPGGANASWLPEYSEVLRGKHVLIIADADAPGRKKARAIAVAIHGIAASVRSTEMPGAKDLTEWVEQGGTRDHLHSYVRALPEWKPELVDGAALLQRIAAYIRRFVGLTAPQEIIVALWVVHTHLMTAVECTPYLAITSAEKESGKTRLLEVFDGLVAKPWMTGRVTAAVLIRKIDKEKPTLLLDEGDAAFGGEKEYAEALRGVLNTGYRQGGKASCCVGKGQEISFRDFSTFCPKAIAGIGRLPDTVTGRSLSIRLKRAARGTEGVARFRQREVKAGALALRVEIETFADQIVNSVEKARPRMPDDLSDRQQDACEPLLAIADLAGGHWPDLARKALVSLCVEAQDGDESVGHILLSDIRDVFAARGVDRISSTDLAEALAEVETSQWGEWNHGNPITPAKVARLLKPYEIVPGGIRIGERTPKGYTRKIFEDAWKRYLRPTSATAQQKGGTHSSTMNCSINENATSESHVADLEREKANDNEACCTVAPSGASTVGEGTEEEL